MSEYFGGGKIKSTSRRNQVRKPYSRSTKNKSLFSRVTDSFKTLLTPITPGWLSQRPQVQGDYVEDSPSISKARSSDFITQSQEESSNFVEQSTPGEASSNYTKPSTSGTSALTQHKLQESNSIKLFTQNLSKNLESNDSKQDLLNQFSKQSSANSSLTSLSEGQVTRVKESLSRPHSRKQDLDDPDSMRQQWLTSSLISRQQATMPSSKRPRFNNSLFGSPMDNSVLSNTTSPPHGLIENSFYPGHTRFGGASARKNTFLSSRSPYRLPKTTKVRIRQLDQSNSSVGGSSNSSQQSDKMIPNMSSTSQKIFEVLDRMSTPLNEVKKIPSPAVPRTPSFMADRQKRRRSLLSQNSELPPTKTYDNALSPVRIRRTAPIIPINRNSSLLRNIIKEKTDNRPAASTTNKQCFTSTADKPPSKSKASTSSLRGVSSLEASLSSSTKAPHKSNTPDSSMKDVLNTSSGGKMKSSKKFGHYSFSAPPEDNNETDLPPSDSAPLPVKTGALPSFSFAPGVHSTPAPTAETRLKDAKKTSYKFDFAKPAVVAKPPTEVKEDTSVVPVFKFSSPDNSILKEGENENKINETKIQNKECSKPKEQQKLLSGSVMDILNKGSSQPTTSTNNKLNEIAEQQKSDGQWECSTCMIYNKSHISTCIACTTPKSNEEKKDSTNNLQSSALTNSKINLTLANKFKKPEGDWDCEVCMIQNKKDIDKCIACESPKPGSARTDAAPTPFSGTSFAAGILSTNPSSGMKFGFGAPATTKSSDEPSGAKIDFGTPTTKSSEDSSGVKFGFGAQAANSSEPKTSSKSKSLAEKFKPKVGEWECEVCMVLNQKDREKCVACESPKPGSSPQEQQSTFKSSFKFGSTSSNLFKFGVPASAQAEKVQSEENLKPEVVEKPKSEEPKAQIEQTTKPAAPSTTSSTPAFSFGVKPKENSNKLKETSQSDTSKKEPVTSTAATKPTFGLSSKPQEAVSTNITTSKTSTGLFSFGKPSQTQTSIATPAATTAEMKTTSSSGFAPTLAQTSASTILPAFGGGLTDKTKSVLPKLPDDKSTTAAKFSFGTPSKPAETGSFKFGNDKPPAASGGFTFGSKDTKTTLATTASPLFGQTSAAPVTSSVGLFGAPAVSSSSGIFGAPASQASAAVFTFGKKTQTNTAGFSTATKTPVASPFGGFSSTAEQKPAEKPSVGFSFGSNATSTATQPSPFGAKQETSGNVFGSASTTTAKTPVFGEPSNSLPKPAFSFGSASETKPAAPAFGGAGGFSFGSKPSNNDTAPAFGKPAAATQPFGTQNSSSTGGFSFGAAAKPNDNTASSNPAFQFGKTNAPAAGSSVFQFGSGNNTPAKTSVPAFGASNTNMPAFGSNTATASPFGSSNHTSTPVPAFGAGNSNIDSTASVFGTQSSNPQAFGASATTTNAMNSSQNSSSGFNFGAAASAGPSFNFGGTTNQTPTFNAPSAQFSMGTGSTMKTNGPRRATTPTGGRTIKQARRKLRK